MKIINNKFNYINIINMNNNIKKIYIYIKYIPSSGRFIINQFKASLYDVVNFKASFTLASLNPFLTNDLKIFLFS